MPAFHVYDHVEKKRLTTMREGLKDLQAWLNDVSLQGLAVFEHDPSSIQHIAKRMVDTKNGGIARIIRSFPRIMKEDLDWPERLLHHLGTIYLYSKAFSKIDDLPENTRDDVLQYGGVTVRKEQIINQTGIEDEWRILGVQLSYEDRLRKRRTWLKGHHSGKYALLLDFTFGRQRFEYTLRSGETLVGELVFYPSNFPLRVHVKKKKKISKKTYELSGFDSIKDFNLFMKEGLTKNPWIWQFPFLIDHVQAFYHEKKFYFKDQDEAVMKLDISEETGWHLLSITGGQEFLLFGEWDFHDFKPSFCKVNARTFRL